MKDQEPIGNLSIFGKIRYHYHLLKRNFAFASEEAKMRAEAKRETKIILEPFDARIKQVKSEEEILKLDAQMRQAFVNAWKDRLNRLPAEVQELVLRDFRDLGERFQKKFELEGNEEDRFRSQVYLRQASVLSELLRAQEDQSTA